MIIREFHAFDLEIQYMVQLSLENQLLYNNRCQHWLIQKVQEQLGYSRAGATLDQRSITQEAFLANDIEIEQILPGGEYFSEMLQ